MAGNDHHIALKTDGTLWAWGSNDYGQIGVLNSLQKMTYFVISKLEISVLDDSATTKQMTKNINQ